MTRWSDIFWGDGNRGFEVLSSNVKNGGIAIEEFQRFLNERYAVDNERRNKRDKAYDIVLVRNVNQPT
jgi:hypothetical protein